VIEREDHACFAIKVICLPSPMKKLQKVESVDVDVPSIKILTIKSPFVRAHMYKSQNGQGQVLGQPYHKITQQIYLGPSVVAVYGPDELRQLGVTHILNATVKPPRRFVTRTSSSSICSRVRSDATDCRALRASSSLHLPPPPDPRLADGTH
jgi:hypothetical protein